MIKKIMLWGGLALLVGILVFGAINRTSAKSGNSESGIGINRSANEYITNGGGHGQASNQATGNQSGQRTNGGGWRGGAGSEAVANRGVENSDQIGVGQAVVDEIIEFDGIVTAMDESILSIQTSDQQTIEISGRAWTYAQEQGISISPGDPVKLSGFYEDNIVEVIQITNTVNRQTVALRQSNGRPMWAGGRRSG